MASGPRDFIARFISNFDRFNTDNAARETENLGEAASTAQSDIDRLGAAASGADSDISSVGSAASSARGDVNQLGDAADTTATDVNRLGGALDDVRSDASNVDTDVADADAAIGTLGNTADTTARDLDDAFDRIRQSSRGVGDGLDDAADQADGAFNEISDEAASTGTEMAASFDGSAESVTDAFQELAANAAASFGPIGIAAGIAGAVLIGNARKNAEELTAITESMTEALRSVEDGSATAAEAAYNFLSGLDPDQYARVAEEANKYGYSLEDIGLAAAGSVDALDRINAAIAGTNENLSELGKFQQAGAQNQAAWNQAITDFIPGAEGFKGLLDELTGASTLTADAAAKSAEAERQRAIDLEASKVASEQAAISTEAYAGVVDAATEVAGKAWDEGADGIISSITEVNAYLLEAVTAQEEYGDNVIAVQKRIGTEGVAALQSIPGDQAAIFASARDATDAQLAETVALSRRRGADTSGALAEGVRSGGGGVFDAGVEVAGRVGGGGAFKSAGDAAGSSAASAMRAAFLSDGVISSSEAAALVAASQAKINAVGPMSIKVKADTTGVQNTLDSLYAEYRSMRIRP